VDGGEKRGDKQFLRKHPVTQQIMGKRVLRMVKKDKEADRIIFCEISTNE